MNLNVDRNCPCNHIEQVYRGKNLLVINRLIKHNYTDTFVTEITSGSTVLVHFFAVISKEMTFCGLGLNFLVTGGNLKTPDFDYCALLNGAWTLIGLVSRLFNRFAGIKIYKIKSNLVNRNSSKIIEKI